MDDRKKLFRNKDPYDHKGTEGAFVSAMRENARFHIENCPPYAKICERDGFSPEDIKTSQDLFRIPPIPTLYYKRNRIFTMPDSRFMIHTTSSGTSGKRSEIRLDPKAIINDAHMVINTTRKHKLLSPIPANYIILGYKATKTNRMATAKTALLSTFYAPALSRSYALKETKSGFEIDFDGIIKALQKCGRSPFPTRFMSFPAYTLFMLREMERRKIKLQLRPHSLYLLGGGWKQFVSESVDKRELYELIRDRLGIPEDRIIELFGAVEHPVLYCDCKNHHFHVPIYSRVIARDLRTLEPLPMGRVGIANFLTPMLDSMPLLSIMTDDLCILRDGKDCGCGIETPYFEILGRVGVSDIKTCAAGAEDILKSLPL